MNTTASGADGGWRDSMLRKNLNDESTGTIWNAIQSTDFKNNITPVLKITNNHVYSNNTSNTSSTTIDKLFILSPSEMGMPIMQNYNKEIDPYHNSYSHVHYYNSNSYMNTIKSSNDGNISKDWDSSFHYLYSGNIYQWWMLPAGSRKMSNDNQAYHNTDSYSYCALFTSSNPSTNKKCEDYDYWLRTIYVWMFSSYSGNLDCMFAYSSSGVVVSFSF